MRLGDSIEVAGKSGTVKNINMFMTELASDDNVQVLIPNGQVWGAVLTNFSVYPTRRVSVSFPVALDKDVESISSGYAHISNGTNAYSRRRHRISARRTLRRRSSRFPSKPWSKAEDASVVRADLMQSLVTATQVPR